MTGRASQSVATDSEPSRELPFPLLVIAVAVLVLACYAPVLGAPFVWDDHELIHGIGGLTQSPWWTPLTKPFWSGNALSSAAYFRPLVVLSFRLDAWLYSDNAAGFHLTNVIVHALNAALVALLARQYGARALAACAAALGFALAPRLTESVAWVSGRTDVLAAFFVLLSLLLWPRRQSGPLLAAFALTLGLLCKEVALAGVPALLLLDSTNRTARARVAHAIPLAIGAIGVLTWRALVLADAPSVKDGLSFGERLVTAAEALGDYVGMLVNPWQPNLQIGWLGAPRHLALAVGLLTLLVIALAAFKLHTWRPSPHQVSFVTLGAVSVVAVLHLAPLPIKVVAADRFLYLPVAAVALWLATVQHRVPPRWAAAALALTLISFSVVTFRRIDDWSDEARLWSQAANTAHPNNPVPLLELGNLNYRVVRLSPAAHFYALAAAKSGTGSTHDAIVANAANVSSLLGEHERALAALHALMNRRPEVPEYRFDFVVAAIQAQNFDLAAQALEPLVEPPATAARAGELVALLARLSADLPGFRAAGGSDPQGFLIRARFLTKTGDRTAALSAWRSVVSSLTATRLEVHEALQYFVVNGEPTDVPPTAERLNALGGNIEPDLAAAFEFRMKQWRALESI